MSEPKILDVCGLSCPEPAMLTRESLLAIGSGTLVVLTDSYTSRTNIERTGKLAGCKVEITQEADTLTGASIYRIALTK